VWACASWRRWKAPRPRCCSYQAEEIQRPNKDELCLPIRTSNSSRRNDQHDFGENSILRTDRNIEAINTAQAIY